MTNPSATKITYEAIKDNKRANSKSPKQQWIAHSQFEIDLFNQLPKTVQWLDESSNKCIARFNKDKEHYTISANGSQHQVHYKTLLNAMPTMPSNAVITTFEAKDIVWV